MPIKHCLTTLNFQEFLLELGFKGKTKEMLQRESQFDSFKFDFLKEGDLEEIVERFTFPWTTPDATKTKWKTYFFEQQAGARIACLARLEGRLIGYGSLLRESKYSSFRSSGIPEIHDVWISDEYRGHGFGKQLICYLEKLAQKENYPLVGLGVGLYGDYGSAQRLYIKLGYIPDGEGVTYQYQKAIPGTSYPLDDDLVIWLKKKLPQASSDGKEYHLERQEEPIPQDEQVLFDGISEDAAKKKGMERIKPFRVYMRDANQSVLGGVSGVTYYGCLYVDMLWVAEPFRNRGFGKKLMEEAEKIAKERKCTFATVNTMDWEALTFYEKLGYRMEFLREGYEKASKMYMLRKEL